jgi:hypothetical protein
MGSNLRDRVAHNTQRHHDAEPVNSPGAELAERSDTPAGLVPQRGGGLPAKLQYAKFLATAGMLPAQYRDRPGNILWAIEYGEMLGIPPMAAITGVHVIEGKPSASAGLISALVRRAGHKLRVSGDDRRATAEIIRADDPDFVYRVEWTLDRARQAGLTSKDVWKKYTAAMLKARAVTEVARDACEEALMGMHYTPEELGADVDSDGVPVRNAPPVVPVGVPAYEPAPFPPAAEAADEQPVSPENTTPPEVAHEPVDVTDAAPPNSGPQTEFPPVTSPGDDPPASTGLLNNIGRTIGKAGSYDDTMRKAIVSRMAGLPQPVASTRDLTATEARQVLQLLSGWESADVLAAQLEAVAAVVADQPPADPKSLPKPGTKAWHSANHPRLENGRIVRADVDMEGDCGICIEDAAGR